MNRILIITVAITASLVGCANRPESIRSSYVPVEKYLNLDCAQLTTALAGAQSGLSDSSRRQNDKANADAVGVFLIGVPFSKLSGDHEGEVAQQKGEIEAVQGAIAKRGCNQSSSTSISVAQRPANSIQEAQQRLTILDDMRIKGLVTIDEYESRRRRILDDALDTRSARVESVNSSATTATQVITTRDFEPNSGVLLSETVLRLTDSKPDRYEFNSGGLAVSRITFSAIRGTLPAPSLIGFRTNQLNIGSTISARLSSSMSSGFDSSADVTGYIKQSPLGSGIIRVEIEGYAPMDVVYGTAQSARGARIAGFLEIDAMTGLTVAGSLRSAHPGFLLRRELVSIERAK